MECRKRGLQAGSTAFVEALEDPGKVQTINPRHYRYVVFISMKISDARYAEKDTRSSLNGRAYEKRKHCKSVTDNPPLQYGTNGNDRPWPGKVTCASRLAKGSWQAAVAAPASELSLEPNEEEPPPFEVQNCEKQSTVLAALA
ncbi:uncharacterized protein BCR38DRAFT_414827 [Pseudomassariella vexata]|uniref:Uncharacterized protein n=1 Tax=Pseudomassariella vexata TaxID=1141098 RepID=A0A1Y2D938_9PEZI|nr:uncharacterized protein BCR38DRAFT_414827 [Pseudomassariella vexata]ORY55646.1 hypothetical protein BCR38DRAFT_414827 [Pseudomassariella vexata]